MTKDEAIEVLRGTLQNVRCGLDTAYSEDQHAAAMIEKALAATATIEAPTSEAAAEKSEYKRLFIEWWQTGMDDSEFFNRAVIMLGITTDDLHAAQPAADPTQATTETPCKKS